MPLFGKRRPNFRYSVGEISRGAGSNQKKKKKKGSGVPTSNTQLEGGFLLSISRWRKKGRADEKGHAERKKEKKKTKETNSCLREVNFDTFAQRGKIVKGARGGGKLKGSIAAGSTKTIVRRVLAKKLVNSGTVKKGEGGSTGWMICRWPGQEKKSNGDIQFPPEENQNTYAPSKNQE